MKYGGRHAQPEGFPGIPFGTAQWRPVGALTGLPQGHPLEGRIEMSHGFGDPVEHQADAHAGSEQHGKPAHVGIVGYRILATDAHLAQWREHQQQAQQHEDIGGADEEPRQIAGQPAAQAGEDLRGLLLQCQGQQHEQQDAAGGDQEDLAVDVQTQGDLP